MYIDKLPEKPAKLPCQLFMFTYGIEHQFSFEIIAEKKESQLVNYKRMEQCNALKS